MKVFYREKEGDGIFTVSKLYDDSEIYASQEEHSCS